MKCQKPTPNIRNLVYLATILIAVGCGGGKKEEGETLPSDNTTIGPVQETATSPLIIEPSPPTVLAKNTMSGVAGAGYPIDGVVTVKGSGGAKKSVRVGAGGKFSINNEGMSPPYILMAEGNVNSKSVRYYSVCMGDGHVNITPLTHLIFSHVVKQNPSGSFDAWDSLYVKAKQK
ncbi:MAG: hypothetical protein ACE5FU_01860 [Nitrospinota bacterium]